MKAARWRHQFHAYYRYFFVFLRYRDGRAYFIYYGHFFVMLFNLVINAVINAVGGVHDRC